MFSTILYLLLRFLFFLLKYCLKQLISTVIVNKLIVIILRYTYLYRFFNKTFYAFECLQFYYILYYQIMYNFQCSNTQYNNNYFIANAIFIQTLNNKYICNTVERNLFLIIHYIFINAQFLQVINIFLIFDYFFILKLHKIILHLLKFSYDIIMHNLLI